MRLLSACPQNLLVALTFSMLIHAMAIGFFTILTQTILDREIAYSTVATIFPLGILTIVLPISPGGLGVGHVAFDRLFATVGLTGGANIFNVYLIGQMVPYLSGIVSYLALKRKGEIPSGIENIEREEIEGIANVKADDSAP